LKEDLVEGEFPGDVTKRTVYSNNYECKALRKVCDFDKAIAVGQAGKSEVNGQQDSRAIRCSQDSQDSQGGRPE
jgi:hypothetical protein